MRNQSLYIRFISCIFVVLLGSVPYLAWGAEQDADIRLGISPQVVAEAQDFWLSITIESMTAPAGTMVLEITTNPAMVEMEAIAPAARLTALGKQQHQRVDGNKVTFITTLGDPITTAGDLCHLRMRAVGEEPELDWLSSSQISAATPGALPLTISFQAEPISQVPANELFHSADLNQDRKIALSELLRGVQLYHAGAYHCQPGSEDGYAPGPTVEDEPACARHDSDFLGSPWEICLSELLQLIQLYNAPSYSYDGARIGRFRPD